MSDADVGRGEPLVTVPRIRASAGALLRDREGQLLILKPTYKGGWTVPGGVIEIDESPWQACRRETKEECGLDVSVGRLVCVDFLHPKPGRPGGMRFLFDCGIFDDAILETVVIQPYEIAESRVCRWPRRCRCWAGRSVVGSAPPARPTRCATSRTADRWRGSRPGIGQIQPRS